MRVYRNSRYIERRSKIGLWASLSGLVLTLAALVMTWAVPQYLQATLVVIWMGFLLSVLGTHYSEFYAGETAPHARLAEAFKGLDDRYALLLHELPVPYVLVEPRGLLVITAKPVGGKVSYRQGRWHHEERGKFFKRLSGQEGLGRPDAENVADIERLKSWLKKYGPEGMEIPVRGVIVFTNPDVQLDAEESPVPALRPSKVKDWLRAQRGGNLPEEQRKALEEALGL